MSNQYKYPDTFLDYIPDPPMGRSSYKLSLEESFKSNRAEIPPVYALLKVTDQCSSRCVYCAHSVADNQIKEASTKILKDVLDQLSQVGAVSVNFTGGEPLQRHDLPELVSHSVNNGLFPVILTNGLLLSKRRDELRKAGAKMFIISVDSIRPSAYSATRGVPLNKVLEGIDALLEYPIQERPIITVTSVVTSANVDHLDEIVEYFDSRQVGIKFCPYHHYGRWEDNQLSPKDPDMYRNAISRIIKLKESGVRIMNSRVYLENFANFTFKDRALPNGYKCYCGYTTLFIDPELNVRSCWSQGLPVAGNLKNSGLEELLQSPRMTRMRKKIKNLNCERCWLLCTAEISQRFL